MLASQQFELVPISALRMHPDNPRRGDVDAIAESVRANGFYGTVVAQRSTGHVLVGNHRMLAAQQEGLDTLPVMWLDVDDDRARRILLVDNRANDQAGYDRDVLAALLAGLDATDARLVGTGYSAQDLAALLDVPPDFAPIEDATRLDRRAITTCPGCGLVFAPTTRMPTDTDHAQ